MLIIFSIYGKITFFGLAFLGKISDRVSRLWIVQFILVVSNVGIYVIVTGMRIVDRRLLRRGIRHVRR